MMFVITPGADWAYVISVGLRDRAIIPAIPFVLAGLTLIGGAYLLWLGSG